ncbi:hypothetical protein [Microbacterium paludicola]|uniref:hypothetical protein n=1 Tax=Microbacterium paludicola TaxID=300019 RepID=UPI00143120C3|nr:hypothetical protein [Microbacterium paludicola]MBF0816272.1 hypothetical protein [Microbacterium paludicola]
MDKAIEAIKARYDKVIETGEKGLESAEKALLIALGCGIAVVLGGAISAFVASQTGSLP